MEHSSLTDRILRAAAPFGAVAFDVFDTLVKRCCARPTDLFRWMERTGRAPEGFCENRIRAERQARARYDREVTLAEIYAEPELHGADPARECQAERAFCTANPPLLAAARALHARGQKLYAISDMYLPAEEIRAILTGCGYDFLEDVFVSSEFGVQKRSGKLFRLFLHETGYCAADVLFVGDDLRADRIGAAAAGIRSFLVPARRPLPYTERTGDDLADAAAALQQILPKDSPAFARGAELLGPLAVSFAGWLHAQRQQLPGARLVFLARDMELIRRVYEMLYPGEQTDYLRVSRKSLLPALLYRPMDDGTLALLADALPRQRLTRGQICEYLGLDAKFLPGDAQQICDLRTRPLDRVTRELLLSLAARCKTAAGEPVREAAALVRQYLQQSGLDHGPILLVDIGSGGTTQRILEELTGHPLDGRYLACDSRLHEQLPAQRARAFLFGGNPAPLWYWAGQPMLERFVSELCGPTVGYAREDHGRTVPRIGRYDPAQDEVILALRKGTLAFAKAWKDSPLSELTLPAQTVCDPFLRMVRCPRSEEIALFGPLTVEDGGSWQLAAPRKITAYLRRPDLAARDFRNSRWKVAFMKQLIGLPLPYDRIYAAMKQKQGR